MSYTEREVVSMMKTQDQLELIENKISILNKKDFLNQAESELLNELHQTANKLRGELPVGAPLTWQNSVTSRPSGGFKSFGEQLACIARASRPGGVVDPRLHAIQNATGLGEGIPSDGSFLVQNDFSNDLLKQVFETGILAPRCKRYSISGNSNSIKINGFDETSRASTRSGGVLGYWLAEAAEITKSKPKFRQINLELKKLCGLVYASDELLADMSILTKVLQDAFVSEINFRVDDAIINGTGAGQPLGILNAGCLVTVNKESGQTQKTVVAENIIKMYSRLLPGSEKNAVWLVNKNVLPQLYTLSLAVGVGGAPIFQPVGGFSQVPYNTLLGCPVIPVEQCATLGTIGDIILADLSGYIIADKGGVKTDMSIHVAFVTDESCFRFVLRIDGQPSLASALTPYKGSDTLSHFIVLQTRS